jgi:hypothetical protein
LLEEDSYYSYNHQHFSYVARGCYARQLERWLQFFPKSQFLFIESESFFEDPGRELSRITGFLGIAPVGAIARMMKENVGTYEADIPPRLRSQLRARFIAANRDLEKLTQMAWRWNKSRV